MKNVTSASRPSQDRKSAEEQRILGEVAQLNSLSIRYTKFRNILDAPSVDIDLLRKISWSGIPEEIRHVVWKLLLGYLPLAADRRDSALARKRKEYEDYVSQTAATADEALTHQIEIDVLRTHASVPLYQQPIVRAALQRILYCWAIRHPASGYVQGINDLVTPFFQVYLQSHVQGDVEKTNVSELPLEILAQVEADTFWSLSKLLDGIQDNYTFAQPGIQRQVTRLKELIHRIDTPLSTHLQKQGVEYIQFAFRWMNCLLMRELPLKCIIRMWDTYQVSFLYFMAKAEGLDGFSDFHLYVCAAFLVKWSSRLLTMEFPDIMIFLQSLPQETAKWQDKDVELLLSEAFMWKSLFHAAPSHLSSSSIPIVS